MSGDHLAYLPQQQFFYRLVFSIHGSSAAFLYQVFLGSPMPCFLVLWSLWNLASQVSCMSLLWVFPRSMSCTLVGCLALHLHRWLMSVIAQISSPVYAQCIGLFVCQLPIVRLLSPVSSCTTGHRLPRALWARIMQVRFCL